MTTNVPCYSLTELIQHLSGHLNSYQIQTALRAWAIKPEYYDQSKFPITATPEELKTTLLDTVIIPYNMVQYDVDVERLIQEYGYMINGVMGDEESPSYAYTVGLLPNHGFEIMMVASVPTKMLKDILNTAAQSILNPSLSIETAIGQDYQVAGGTNLRAKVYRFPLSSVVDNYCGFVKRRYTIAPEHEILVLHVGDQNNLLPGEEGYNEEFKQFPLPSVTTH